MSDRHDPRESGTQRLIRWLTGAEPVYSSQELKSDLIGARASVQPLTGWLLSGLIGYVVYLTLIFGPIFECKRAADEAVKLKIPNPSCLADVPGSVISDRMAWTTYALVVAVALLALVEPWLQSLIRRMVDRIRKRSSQWPSWLRGLGTALLTPVVVVWRLPGIILSGLDALLARPAALLGGAGHRGWRMRYLQFALIATAALLSGLFLPPPWGLGLVVFAMLLVLGVVRRWAWSEADRATFVTERGTRAGALSVGFRENLRDEALAGVILLLVLFPLLLSQVEQWASSWGQPAFAFKNDKVLPAEPWWRLWDWMGFFAAELAKTIPLVDWSEVFGAANGSPIEPKSALGAQVVFGMRATLDLVLVAAVVQAVSIATRLQDQLAAFEAKRLPILDPIEEERRLREVRDGIELALDIPITDHQSVIEFKPYDADRLRALAAEPETRQTIGEAAIALLATQHKGEETDRFLFGVAREKPAPHLQHWAAAVIRGLPDVTADRSDDEISANMLEMLGDTYRRPNRSGRAAIARRLGRMPPGEDRLAALNKLLMDDDLVVGANAVVALAKLGDGDVATHVASFKKDLGVSYMITSDQQDAALCLAYAMAWSHGDKSAEDIAEGFDFDYRDIALRAARVQREPVGIEAATAASIGASYDQTVLLSPGSNGMPRTFTMGAADGRAGEQPPTEITMRRAFAFGRFPVRDEEYRDYCKIVGKRHPGSTNREKPVVQVNWYAANEYARWLEGITGERFRLPSETEWEYACRAGTTQKYWWGDEYDLDKHDLFYLSPVLTKPGANAWGIWSLYGHVYEWCDDVWHSSHSDRPKTEEVWLSPASSDLVEGRVHRVVRGGSFNWPRPSEEHKDGRRKELRSSYRNEQNASHIQTNYGFRLVREINSRQLAVMQRKDAT